MIVECQFLLDNIHNLKPRTIKDVGELIVSKLPNNAENSSVYMQLTGLKAGIDLPADCFFRQAGGRYYKNVS